ncbi:MAG: DUF559 domain-containing protein [Bacteroidetes bacterium]|nr:DUF559 domain-containing protein [Bacteroidota bacterium]MBU2585781.1 DUF559 domain-containing protein [Bacteroidota bacterium]
MKRKIIPYDPTLKEKARQLRNKSTVTEIMLWKRLKGKQMSGFDFHRQKPLSKYIVDFFCNELMLAIEIDGMSHSGQEKYDKKRQQELENLGIRFLRFESDDVFFNLGKVLDEIESWIRVNSN